MSKVGGDGVKEQAVRPTEPLTPEPLPGAAVPIVAARFMLHLKTHGMTYALAWLVLDATGTWALVTGQVATMC